MSTLAAVSAMPWTGVLGWTLLHFVWQGAAVALLLWCGLALLDERSSRLRYALCCGALALAAVLPAATFVLLGGLDSFGRGTVVAAPWLVDIQAVGGGAGEPWTARIAEMLNLVAPILPWIWLAGVAVYAARLGVGLTVARRMRQTSVVATEAGIEPLFRAVAERLHLRRMVRLLESARVEVPTVVGWLRPAVLLPLGCFAGLSTVQVEALLAHELAHIRRHDYLVSVLQSVVEALLFYHPAVWWISRQVRRERECCCDEIAAAVAGDRLQYARALSRLEEQRISAPAIVLGANGGVLTMRIKRVLGYRQGTVASQMGAVAVLSAVLVSGGVFAVRSALAQSDAARSDQSVSSSGRQTQGNTAPAPDQLNRRVGDQGSFREEKTLTFDSHGGVYLRWLNEDVLWIIHPDEREAFKHLTNDNQRDQFIKNFWLRRDPAGAPPYTYRTQLYGRIAYANQHFGESTAPGWKTDRGHAYIAYGKPDAIEAHPAGGTAPNGKQIGFPFEAWHYSAVPGFGDGVDLVFVDGCRCGQYNYTIDGAKDGLPGAKRAIEPASRIAGSGVSGRYLPVVARSQAEGSLSGVVMDPTGAVVARATVAAIETATGQHQTQETGSDGRFRFGLPSGSYLVEVSAPGFQRVLQENVPVSRASTSELSFRLAVGSVAQNLNVSSADAGSQPPSDSGAASRAPIRVSGATIAGNAVQQPPPLYPSDAKAKHIQGTVVLHATLSKTGDVENLQVVSGPDGLQSSAMDAVREWKYRPYLLNGEPVAVDTTIRVNYTLGSGLPPVPPQAAPGASVSGSNRPLRVSAGVMAGQALTQPPPVYPPDAKANGIQGVVVLRASISKQGDVEDLQVVSGPDELRQSAIDAVKQWKYKPFLLNGEPVAVETTINVHYSLAH